ncbi:MAG: hypothetical protein IPL27_24160 [Lewinellaceae bacterium]|nr:hypothetical protein [Lewinellaceae bacterium]
MLTKQKTAILPQVHNFYSNFSHFSSFSEVTMQRLFTMVFIATLFCSSTYALGQQKSHSARILSGTPGTVQFDLKGHTEYVKDVRWSPDGTKLATVSGGALDNSAIIWSAVTGEKLYTLPYAKSIGWSPDGSKIATITLDTADSIGFLLW